MSDNENSVFALGVCVLDLRRNFQQLEGVGRLSIVGHFSDIGVIGNQLLCATEVKTIGG